MPWLSNKSVPVKVPGVGNDLQPAVLMEFLELSTAAVVVQFVAVLLAAPDGCLPLQRLLGQH